MSYQVLALKYRPQTFKEVIGQSHVTTTLANAISSGRVAHAILFAGPRGTGKTSIARILAKAMNCESGPSPEPCNKCKSCKSITSGKSIDVFEIDGASNNSVDQIRELRSNITYLPSISKFKIYIIDEVHMLSTAAFNALLKTLEEPPEHVMFIFATTEPHKIPITILSRCQRHDLGRISLSEIADQLENICIKEGYTIQRESIETIASEADGSMRDSLSLLDKIMSSSLDKTISHETILQNLGIIDKKIISDISKAIIDLNGELILDIINRIHDLGLDLKKFYSDIIKYFRNLTIVKICAKNTQFPDISSYEKKIMEDMVSSVSKGYLLQIFNILIQEESTIKFTSHTKIVLEMTLLNLIQIRQSSDIDDIIKKLDYLIKGKIPNSSTANVQIPVADQNTESEKSPYDSNEKAYNEDDLNKNYNLKSSCAESQNIIKNTDTIPHIDDIQHSKDEYFKRFVDKVIKIYPFVAPALSKMQVEKITDTNLVLKGQLKPGELSRIESRMENLMKIADEIFNKPLKIEILSSPPMSEPDSKHGKKTPAQARKEVLNHPLVVEALKIFNGNIVDIKTKT